MIHRQEERDRNQRTYMRSELMAHGEKLRSVEDQLKDASRRLDALEAELTKRSSLATIFTTWWLGRK